MNTLFQRKRSPHHTIAFFFLISIVMMVVDQKEGYMDHVRSGLATAMYPIQYVVHLPVEIADLMSESLAFRRSLIDENSRLKDEQLVMNSQLQRFAVLEAENERLRGLLESSLRLKDRVLIAELLAVELQPYKHQIRINKGKNEGAYDGQPILDSSGIMGQIIHVSPFYSDVLLITDPTHSLPVQINRNGLRAIAVGTGQKAILQLEHLPNNSDIQEGDLIVTSGLGNRFPSGYPVGIVKSISLSHGEPFAKIEVTPSAQLDSSREVLLVWPHEQTRRRYQGVEGFAHR